MQLIAHNFQTHLAGHTILLQVKKIDRRIPYLGPAKHHSLPEQRSSRYTRLVSSTYIFNIYKMHNGELYERSANFAHQMVKLTLDEYAPQLRWRSDGQDSLLDIGCGTANATVELILPLLPAKYARAVGADISESMLDYARQMGRDQKIEFKVLDVERPLRTTDADAWTRTPFDHITSFFCLNWVQDVPQVMRNIYELLAAGGDLLLTSICKQQNFDFFQRIALDPRLAEYMHDMERFVPPSHRSSDPAGDLERILAEVGFGEFTVNIVPKSMVFEAMDGYKGECC